MKPMRRTLRLMALLMTGLMLLAAVSYVVNVSVNREKWLNRSANVRLAAARKKILQGTVYDSAGLALSWSDEVGTRSYIADDETRLALAHTIGEQTGQNSSGVEYRHATTLLGMDVTRAEYTLQNLSGTQPVGYDLVLTVNAELTTYLASLFPEGALGAAVIINYKTGEILAQVSFPSFDPANMGAPVQDSAYYNKVLQIRYAPGSTFKTVTLAAALDKEPGLAKETFSCGGVWNLGTYSISCAGNTAHGALLLHDAYAKSCNVTFSSIAYQTGGLQLKQTAEEFGFNTIFNFSDIAMNPSYCLNDSLSDSEVIQAGIGQGTTQVTPLHLAMISGAIANGGVMMEPKLIKEVRHHNGETVSTMQSTAYKTVCSQEMSETLAKYMHYVVTNGTGTKAQISGYTAGYVCGKTGSAEWTNDKTQNTNAWYTGFLYGDDKHPYAIAVLVEQGGSGGSVAAPIASKALEKAIELGV